jgi:hypothetical protein
MKMDHFEKLLPPLPESPNIPTNHEVGGITSWTSDFAGHAWGATKVVGDFLAGAGHEIVEHPLKTAAEVAAGVGVAFAAAELGIGLAAGATAAGVALVSYGAVRGVQIAAKEGVGAIPEHMKEAYESVKHSAGDVISAAGVVYRGEQGKKGEDAAATLENVGRATVPLAAVAVGGLGSDLAKVAVGGGAKILEDVLPPMTLFQPAYAVADGVAGGAGVAARIAARSSTEGGVFAGGAGATAVANENMSDFERQQHFIEGIKGSGVVEATPGPATEVGKGFKNIDEVLKNGGTRGFFRYNDDGNGWYSVEVTDGPLQGRTGIWKSGSKEYQFDGLPGQTKEFQLPR